MKLSTDEKTIIMPYSEFEQYKNIAKWMEENNIDNLNRFGQIYKIIDNISKQDGLYLFDDKFIEDLTNFRDNIIVHNDTYYERYNYKFDTKRIVNKEKLFDKILKTNKKLNDENIILKYQVERLKDLFNKTLKTFSLRLLRKWRRTKDCSYTAYKLIPEFEAIINYGEENKKD